MADYKHDKIVKWEVVGDAKPDTALETLNEFVKRPHALSGKTYKMGHTPYTDHSIYITINDIVINGKRQPFEVFITSKDANQIEWLNPLALLISAVFRKGGNVHFIVDELKSVVSGRGGYWRKQRFLTSISAEIGTIIEAHLDEPADTPKDTPLLYCEKCNSKSVVVSSGCKVCSSCGDSSCG